MIDNNLASRLLTAAWSTYFRDPVKEAAEGVSPEAATRNAEVGYTAPPEVFIDGTTFIWDPPFNTVLPEVSLLAARDAVTVGVTSREVVVAFRGTIPLDGAADKALAVGDWLNNFNSLPQSWPGVGWVHPGFAEAVDNLWDKLAGAIAPLVSQQPTLPVCFTGHSKGGAMAHIAAVRFKRASPSQKVLVCTFAAPKAGDSNFVGVFNAAVADSRRYEYGNDIVPHVPSNGGLSASAVGGLGAGGPLAAQLASLAQAYRPAGKLYYLPELIGGADPGEPVHEISSTQRILNIAAAVPNLSLPLNRSWLGKHHDIRPGSGYHTWVNA